MKPPKREKNDWERIKKYDEWLESIITSIEYDENHEKVFQGEKKIGPCIRFKFEIKDHEHPHRSRWMSFSYAEKANLYKKFISQLVHNAEPDIDFDLDELKGMEIRTMWSKSEDGEYDNLEMVRPMGLKIGQKPEKELTPREAAQARNPKVDGEVSF